MTTKPAATEPPATVDDWVSTPKSESEPVTPPPPAPKEKMKRLTLDIPESLHKAIKTRSVQEGVAMADMLREDLSQKYGKA
jgi:predicted DNA binding CopG/RHH family protein